MTTQIYTLFCLLPLFTLPYAEKEATYLTELSHQSIHHSINNLAFEGDNNNDPYIIVIDPGHGGKDQGCSDAQQSEKSLVLRFAKVLANTIKQHSDNIQIYFTRNEDVSVPLTERPLLANHLGADIFISIHANAINDDSVHGFETYVFGNSEVHSDHTACIHNHLISDTKEKNTSLTMAEMILGNITSASLTSESVSLATNISDQVSNYTEIKNRGLKQARFKVLKNARMPSVLLEVGYLTNAGDRRLLNSESGQEKLADKIALGILQYLEQD